ncbi:MAG: hypothetical protein ACM31E_10615 [Fibrobacterota bacterium]
MKSGKCRYMTILSLLMLLMLLQAGAAKDLLRPPIKQGNTWRYLHREHWVQDYNPSYFTLDTFRTTFSVLSCSTGQGDTMYCSVNKVDSVHNLSWRFDSTWTLDTTVNLTLPSDRGGILIMGGLPNPNYRGSLVSMYFYMELKDSLYYYMSDDMTSMSEQRTSRVVYEGDTLRLIRSNSYSYTTGARSGTTDTLLFLENWGIIYCSRYQWDRSSSGGVDTLRCSLQSFNGRPFNLSRLEPVTKCTGDRMMTASSGPIMISVKNGTMLSVTGRKPGTLGLQGSILTMTGRQITRFRMADGINRMELPGAAGLSLISLKNGQDVFSGTAIINRR